MDNTPYYATPEPSATKAPGRIYLLVVGILYIVLDGIGILYTISVIMTTNVWLLDFGGEAMRETWMVVYAVEILVSLIAVATGILGICFRNKIDKARLLIGLAVLCMITMVSYNVAHASMIFYYTRFFNIVFLIGLALPILFIVGAVKNKKADDAGKFTPPFKA